MTNKIVILDDSVLLYEHYINDDQWERTLAFPRGGLTYLISNGTIKFYAYEDYFYRNCLISMQLPIYIVDEFMHIDGEYDDLEEITDILDRIFPTNDIDAQFDKYLKKIDADLLYQPIGDYALKSDIPDVSEFVTTDELVDALDDKLDASAYTPCDLSNYYTKQETSSKTQIDTALARKADNDKVYTKNESDAKYQIKLVAGDNITISGNVISAAGSSGTPVDAYTKAESDARYQPKGNYATEQWVLNQKYITSSSTVFNNYYTTANTYNKTEINQFITNIQNQISALTEALNECCSGTPTPSGSTIYRWVVDPNDYYCLGVNKYELEVKQQSEDNGDTWTDVVPRNTRMGSNILEYYSTDCGFTGCTPFTATTQYGETLTPNHLEQVYGHLSWNTTEQGIIATSSTTITAVTISDCVFQIDTEAFAPKSSSINYANLQIVEIPSSVTRIDSMAFATKYDGVCRLQRVICRAEYPPTMSENYQQFSTEGGLTIYVPAASVNTYKADSGWSKYADRIQAIPS